MSMLSTDPESTITKSKPHNGLRPRRTLNRLALALAGVAAAILGQITFGYGTLWDGLLLYGLGLILFIRALVDHPYPNYKFSLSGADFAQAPLVYRGWWRVVGGWLILLAVGASIFGYISFSQGNGILQGWQIYLASLGLYLGGALLLTPGATPGLELRSIFPNRRIIFVLALILGLALFMRLFNFTQQPFGIWYDEAEAGLQARRMLQDPDYRPVFYQGINVTGHFLATYSLALRWLGDNIHSIRFVSVLFGLAGVLAAFLFGQALQGARFGLILAFLVATARWHVNFSRIAMTGVDTTFFIFLSLFFLTRFFQVGRLRNAVWAGLTLGLGLMFYTAFRLYVLALAIFALVILIRWFPQLFNTLRNRGWQRYLAAATIILIASWLVVMPMAQFALDNPDAFWRRIRQISIFTKRDQADLTQALWESAQKHLLMFNYSGDTNGRHNLPGEPMLDPLTGVFFILGFGLALARTRYPANTFFLILFPLALVGGVFSVDFEAPQALRSIVVIPSVIYFAGLALTALSIEAEKVLQPLPRFWVVGPAITVAAYIFIFNAYTYFERQAHDFASWNAFSAPETITARQMAKLGPGYEYILSPFLINHPATHFLAPEITRQQWLDLPDALPVRDPTSKPVAIFIHPDDVWVYGKARLLYPNAKFEIFSGPTFTGEGEGPASVYSIELQPADLMAARGLELRYWPNIADASPEIQLVTAPLQSSRVFNISATWPDDGPAATDFTAEWQGILYAPDYGPYSFRLITPGPGRLEIDGNTILEGQGQQITRLLLAQGNHRIQLRAEAGVGQIALYWQPPGQDEALIPAWALYAPPITNHGLQATFYPNNNWAGQPALQRIDPFLDTYFHLIPLNRPYTVEWQGSLIAPQSGIYHLALRVVQEAELYINGQLLLATTTPNQVTEKALRLEAGLHDILIRYRDSVDRSRVHLYWMPPNGPFDPIPSDFLWPPMGDYPDEPPPAQAAIAISSLDLQHITSLGIPGSQPGQFQEPRDVAVLPNGGLVIADTGNRRVQIFNRFYIYQGMLSADEFPFEEPLAVGVNSRGEILVLDSALQWLYRYDIGGDFMGRFGGPEARLFHPRGLTILADDTLAVADTGQARITFFSPDGLQIGAIGALGTGPGQLNEPTDVLRDSQGTYFVVEAENDRLQWLDAAGNPLNQWAIPPAYAYNGPHLAFAPDGTIFMTESQSNSLLRYSQTGVLLDQWQVIDAVSLVDPLGVYFDPATSRLFVTDIATHQVHAFEVRIITDASLGDN